MTVSNEMNRSKGIEIMKKMMMTAAVLFLSLGAKAGWQDYYVITSEALQAHRIPSNERVHNYNLCDYRLKLPRNISISADRYIPAKLLVNATHFLDEMHFEFPKGIGAHAVSSGGNFQSPVPAQSAQDSRDLFTLRVMLGRGGAHSKILNVLVNHQSIAAPFMTSVSLSALPSYETKLVIQRKCEASAVEAEANAIND